MGLIALLQACGTYVLYHSRKAYHVLAFLVFKLDLTVYWRSFFEPVRVHDVAVLPPPSCILCERRSLPLRVNAIVVPAIFASLFPTFAKEECLWCFEDLNNGSAFPSPLFHFVDGCNLLHSSESMSSS